MWQGDCDNQLDWRIPFFGDLAWNLGPYIVHSPLQFSTRPDSITVSAEMWADTFYQATQPSVTNAVLHCRWLPSGTYSTLPMARTGTDTYAATIHSVPTGTTGISYYLSATDHRSQTANAPADAPQNTFTATFPVTGNPPGDRHGEVIPFSTHGVPGGVLMEWARHDSVQWYEVHAGHQADFGPNSRTLISRQSPGCPRYLLTVDRADADIPSVTVYGFRAQMGH